MKRPKMPKLQLRQPALPPVTAAGSLTKAHGGDFRQSLRSLNWYWRHCFLEAKRLEVAARTERTLTETTPEGEHE